MYTYYHISIRILIIIVIGEHSRSAHQNRNTKKNLNVVYTCKMQPLVVSNGLYLSAVQSCMQRDRVACISAQSHALSMKNVNKTLHQQHTRPCCVAQCCATECFFPPLPSAQSRAHYCRAFRECAREHLQCLPVFGSPAARINSTGPVCRPGRGVGIRTPNCIPIERTCVPN